jgi:hypothetical protein
MLPGTFDAGGANAALAVTPMLGIYNTQRLQPGEGPKSLKELVTDAKWLGG